MAYIPKLKIRRTTLTDAQLASKEKTLAYGEPALVRDNYLTVGLSAGNTDITSSKRIKLVDKTLSDNGVFYKTASSVDTLYKDDGTTALNLKLSSAAVGSATQPIYINANGLPVAGNTLPTVPSAGSTATDVATTSSGGSANTYSKSDHQHKITAAVINTALGSTAVSNATNSVASSKVKVTNTANKIYVLGITATPSGNNEDVYGQTNVYVENSVLMGAAWNDFAECRKCVESIPGTVVCEIGDGTLEASKERLQAGAYVISDTYGMLIGETEEAKTPIAVAGRVLVYMEDIEGIYPGAPVCAAPDGKASIMNREEVKEYPDRILGYVSEIPLYEEWNGRTVNNRIWIKVK